MFVESSDRQAMQEIFYEWSGSLIDTFSNI